MKPTSNERRGLRAMGDFCNGVISESEGRWLSEQLREKPAMRELYVDYMTMHACLAAEAAALRPTGHDSTVIHGPHDASTATPASTAEAGRPRRVFRPSWLALAASVALVALFAGILQNGLFTQDVRIAEKSESAELATPIARITGTQNCRWADGGDDIGYGSELSAGQVIRLREGFAEITFTDGATMLLESPATVVFEAADQIEIQEGRLAAIVPPGSNDFCIHTKTFELSNVDAEFGLLARETGTSELHVFNGTVKADVLNADGHRRRQLEVHASEAVLASPSTTTVFEFAANETHFVRSMSSVPGPHDGLLAYEGFVYPEGPLSAQNGGFGWAGPWSTIAADSFAGHESNSVSARGLSMDGIVPRGNHAAITAQRNRIRRSLATSIGGVFDAVGLVEDQNGVRLVGQDGTTVYLSFLQRVSETDDGFYGLELHRGDGNANRVMCIGNGADDTGYGVTSAVNVYGSKNFPALGEETTEVNFFVVKICYGTLNRDLVEVYRNPESLDDEELCQPDVVLKGNFAFDRISLANYDGSKTHEVDELCVGTHFLAVTGRFGGERGRLLRRLTENRPPERGRQISSWGLMVGSHPRSDSRNFALFATMAH